MDIKTKNLPFSVKSTSTKTEDGQEYGYFEGYASTFGNEDCDGDIIINGAFAESIASGRKVKMLWQHGWDNLIGSYPVITEDSKGLFVQGRINLGVEQGREAYALMKSGDLDSMSIGFVTVNSTYNEKNNLRYLNVVDLYEISLVTMPANDQALVTDVKSIEEITSLKDAEKILRQNGFSKNAATVFVAKLKEFSPRRDAVDDVIIADDDRREAVDFEAKLSELSFNHKADQILNLLKGK